jgi:hypothetical protein
MKPSLAEKNSAARSTYIHQPSKMTSSTTCFVSQTTYRLIHRHNGGVSAIGLKQHHAKSLAACALTPNTQK